MTNPKQEGKQTVCTITDNKRQRLTLLKALNTLKISCHDVTGTNETENNDLQIKSQGQRNSKQ